MFATSRMSRNMDQFAKTLRMCLIKFKRKTRNNNPGTNPEQAGRVKVRKLEIIHHR